MHARVPVAAMVLAALASAGPAAAQRMLTIGSQTPPTALDPHFHNATSNVQALRQVFEALFEVDNSITLQPRLAESLRPLDALRWELVLREGVRFHDGTPLAPADIAFSFARIPNVPNAPTLFTNFTRAIAEVQVTGPRTLILRTREPAPLLPWDLAAPMILSERIHGPEAATAEFNSGRLAIGTGPYRHVAFNRHERFELARNPGYWGEAPPWERVVIRYIPQSAPRTAALLSGEVDVIDNVAVQDVPRLSADPRLRIHAVDGLAMVYLFPDAARERTPEATDRAGRPLPGNPLADRRVREALSLAINRVGIAERLYSGLARPADQLASPGAEHRLEGLGPLPYDPARARALLAEAGYPQGFRLVIHGPTGNFQSDDNLLQAIAQGFTRIGVETTVQVLPPAVLLSRATLREFSLFMNYQSSHLALNTLRQLAMTRDAAEGYGPFNRQHYANPAVDAPARAALRSIDPETRRRHTQAALAEVQRDQGVIPVVYLRNVWAARRDRVTWDPSPFNQTSALYARPAE